MNIKGLAITLALMLFFYWHFIKATSPKCWEAQAEITKSKAVKITVTSANKRFAEVEPTIMRHFNRRAPQLPVITVDVEKKYQKWLGIGGAPTDAACYMFNTLSPEAREKIFFELFHPSQMAFNFCRVPMGASDFATHAYSYCDSETPDPQLTKFNIDHDKKYILPQLREMIKLNPEMRFLFSPWSPPGWMKPNKSMLGGNMNRTYLGSWVEYFIKAVQAYATEGVPIYAVTIQNEPDTDQEGRMPAAMTSGEVQASVVYSLGKRRDEEKLPFEIWVNDHNYSQFGTVLSMFDDANVLNAAGGVAWHGYTGDPGKMTMIHDKFPTKDQHWTEGGPDVLTWEWKPNPDYPTDWAKWGRIIATTQRNWCRTFIAWNLALDEKAQPNIGPFPCGGIVTIDSKTGEITRSGQYYAMGQYSKFIKRDAVRVASEGDVPQVTHVAWVNPNGDKVVVLTNEGDAKSVRIQVGDASTDVTLEPNSVTTLTWE